MVQVYLILGIAVMVTVVLITRMILKHIERKEKK